MTRLGLAWMLIGLSKFTRPTQLTIVSEFKMVNVLFGPGVYIQEEGPGASLGQHGYALTQKEAQQ